MRSLQMNVQMSCYVHVFRTVQCSTVRNRHGAWFCHPAWNSLPVGPSDFNTVPSPMGLSSRLLHLDLG